MDLFHVRLGFSFSAGLFAYVLNFSHAQHPLLLLPIGGAYFALYYVVFRVCIVRLNLATPGRDADDEAMEQLPLPVTPAARGAAFVAALGGARNLTEVAACTTRLRLVLVDNRAIDEAALRRLGARGILRSSEQGLQVVLGPIADQVAGEMRAASRADLSGAAASRADLSHATPSNSAASGSGASSTGGHDAQAMLTALGGRGNVVKLETAAGRLLISTVRPESIDEAALRILGIRGIARPAGLAVQVLVTGGVEETAEPLRRLLGAA
jgi:N-acetylglucosamine PTS system EIICBA or EIICB component